MIQEHFFNPNNVGSFDARDENVGRAIVGSYENGVIIHFQIKVQENVIKALKFRAYGNVPTIAACSYVTQYLQHKTLSEAQELTSETLVVALEIPPLKIHCALLIEDAIKKAILDYQHRYL
jgi:nitrogen fixation NifU-like protein